MRKELRGRDSKEFYVEDILDIQFIIDLYNNGELSDVLAEFFEEQFGYDVSCVVNANDPTNLIREKILETYNKDITSSMLFMYYFLNWYDQSSKVLNRMRGNIRQQNLLDFDDFISVEVIQNIGTLLSQNYDKKNPDEYVNHAKYRLISNMLNRTRQNVEVWEYNNAINCVINNCRYLNIIDVNGELDNKFLLEWEYYSVDKIFRDVIDTFDSELSKDLFEELKDNEFSYFCKIKKAEVDFSSIKSYQIYKNGKIRTVYTANKAIDQATLIYLSKRLNNEFHIKYPNRDKIMELSFNLIDSLPNLDDYTIYKFDFNDFFNSVDIKKIYEKYIEHSNIYTYEKELILKLAKMFKCCVQGIPVSNALIEIISRDFDEQIKASFSENGLVFYKRYVDDCILIFNHKMKRNTLEKIINECRLSIFGKKVTLSQTKTSYQTKFDGDDTFDYLGYSFSKCYWDKNNNMDYYFEFGIAQSKIEKYKKQLDAMFNAYEIDNNERILLRRIQYYNSRIVFYNYTGSKYVNKSTWDVRGIINSYRMLRRYVIYDDTNISNKFNNTEPNIRVLKAGENVPYRIQKDTYIFLRYYMKEKRDSLSVVPQYLQGKGCNTHTLWNGFIKNKSIVFQPNIGWSSAYLSHRLDEIGLPSSHKSYYEKTRDYYTALIKKL